MIGERIEKCWIRPRSIRGRRREWRQYEASPLTYLCELQEKERGGGERFPSSFADPLSEGNCGIHSVDVVDLRKCTSAQILFLAAQGLGFKMTYFWFSKFSLLFTVWDISNPFVKISGEWAHRVVGLMTDDLILGRSLWKFGPVFVNSARRTKWWKWWRCQKWSANAKFRLAKVSDQTPSSSQMIKKKHSCWITWDYPAMSLIFGCWQIKIRNTNQLSWAIN